MSTVSQNPKPQDGKTTEPAKPEVTKTVAPRVNLPDNFHGQRSKLGQFILQYQMYLAFNGDKFEAESLKVLWIASFLRDTAAHWIEPALSDYLTNRHATGACTQVMAEKTKVIFRTVAGFTTSIKGVFGDPNETEQSEKHLLGIRQRGSVHEYTAEFHRYSMRLDWTDSGLRAQYYRGLKDHIKDELSRADKPDTLEEMIKTATTIDERIQERQKEKGGYFAPTQFRKPQYPQRHGKNKGHFQPNTNNKRNHYDPMELDGAERGDKGQAEKQKRREKGLCYTCGKAGHLARDCSQKKQGGKPWNKPKREFALAERKPGYREFAIAERTSEEDTDWDDVTDEEESQQTQDLESLDSQQESQVIRDSLDELPGLNEIWSIRSHYSEQRIWMHPGKPDFLEKRRTLDSPEKGLECIVVYRDQETIVFQEISGWTDERPRRYTTYLKMEEEHYWYYEPLDDHLQVKDTWVILQQFNGRRYWQRRQPLGEAPQYQSLREDIIQGFWQCKLDTPYTLVSYNQGLRKWLDETTGEITMEQRNLPAFPPFAPDYPDEVELAATGELDQLIVPVQLNGIAAAALIDSGAMGCFMNPEFAEKWDIPTTRNEKPYRLTLLGGKDAGHDGWVRRRTDGIVMVVNGHQETLYFDIVPIGRHDLVLGTLWLNYHNPSVDWVTRAVKFDKCHCRGS